MLLVKLTFYLSIIIILPDIYNINANNIPKNKKVKRVHNYILFNVCIQGYVG